jgi:hypothetical protein
MTIKRMIKCNRIKEYKTSNKLIIVTVIITQPSNKISNKLNFYKFNEFSCPKTDLKLYTTTEISMKDNYKMI